MNNATDFYSVAWKPMHEPALLPASDEQAPTAFFSIAWQVPLRALYYPNIPLPSGLLRQGRLGPQVDAALDCKAIDGGQLLVAERQIVQGRDVLDDLLGTAGAD